MSNLPVNTQQQPSQAIDRAARTVGIPAMQKRRAMIVQLMNEIMIKGQHYGIIPGTKNHSLLKPGIDMICSTFGLTPHYEVKANWLENNHVLYEVHVTLTSINSDGNVVGAGIGLCSTMEKKYRYRWSGKGGNRVQVENEDIADQYNTVLKMAMKRALSSAVQTVTGCADIFAGDPSEVEAVNPETGEILDYEDPFAKEA